MRLKKHYDPESLETGPVVSFIEIQHQSDTWKPSRKVVDLGISEGWLSIVEGFIVLKTAEDLPDVRYNVLAPPGYYCCHDGQKLSGEKQAKAYVAENFGDKPHPVEPAGYVRHNFYLTEVATDG